MALVRGWGSFMLPHVAVDDDAIFSFLEHAAARGDRRSDGGG